MSMALSIYIAKTTKAFSKFDVCATMRDILGPDSIDRITSIDALEGDKRVFIITFWRVPRVVQFHDEYTTPTDTIHGVTMPWWLEQLDPYGIFKDGNFPAPHFLRNSKNFTDAELDELGIGGAGEFVYVQLPTNEGTEFHWQMYRNGTYYMPDMSYYNKPHMEPLASVGSPRYQDARITNITRVPPRREDLNRWRDFYLEYPKTWPNDLTDEERAHLEEDYVRLVPPKSRWTPECGRDPTNLAEEQERLERLEQMESTLPKRMHATRKDEPFDEALTLDDLHLPGLTRSISLAPDIPQRESAWTPYPAHERMYFEDSKWMNGIYKWNYRSFD
jgi:hypothetical protein